MDAAVLREDMVDGLEHALDGLDDAVARAMREVPRHRFVPERPYDNRASDFEGTHVLAPATAARLLTALSPDPESTTLVVGAGVGYTAAVLAEMTDERRVHAVDITRRIVYAARHNLRKAGYDAAFVDCRDGARGLPEYAPFDRILVEAASVRPPAALADQLAEGGRLVMPHGGPDQTLAAFEPGPDGIERVETFGPVALGPLLVEGEQAGSLRRNRTEREDREFAEQGYFAPTGWEQNWIDWDEQL